MIRKIISGAQTGADRGGLDAALELERGGWAPMGWKAEDGVIPESYRVGMRESQSEGYRFRTQQNVIEGDGTLILSFGLLPIDSGSMLTARFARKMGRTYRHIMILADGGVSRVALSRTLEWLHELRINVLNVAGPRESVEPGIQAAARKAVMDILSYNRTSTTTSRPDGE